jgi:hypothetical protein
VKGKSATSQLEGDLTLPKLSLTVLKHSEEILK